MKTRVGIDARKVWAERKRGGRLPLPAILRLKVRFFTDGGVIGSREFVGKVVGDRAEGNIRPESGMDGKAKSGASRSGVPMRYGAWKGLHVLRDLRTKVVE